ncbi:class I SAM-dependent methyltransferase [Deinococcus apachensis]|uniref:class I SAM-dependent methyltransferase n=1 Tax=Deinococcus apachensis TaxID=309886 RepID=UPI00036D3460|nr:class I SAM-dependent methyltransferase [Deinococcus apachensis]
MTADSPAEVATQYATDQNLRVRMETHERYGVGPGLEPRVDELLALRGDEALLDVGTGPGNFPGRLHAQGHRGRLVGVDLSPGMVERARETYPEVEFVGASADTLPFPVASFDVLTARHMLYHVPDVPAALTEFARVLRSGGRFLAVTNAAGYMSELWDVVAEVVPDEPELAGLLGSRAGSAVFSKQNGEGLVRESFGNVQVNFLNSALVFPSPEPVLAYLASMTALQRLTGEDRTRVRVALGRALAPRFRAGEWRVSKRVALIRAVKR